MDLRIARYLDELHEEMDILAVELLAEVVDRLVHVLRQRVLLAAPDEVALTPDPLHVLPWRHRRHRRGRQHGRRLAAEQMARTRVGSLLIVDE